MTDYPYVNTRICAMRGRLLSRAAVEEMLNLRDSEMVIDRLLEGSYQVELAEALAVHPPLKALDEAMHANLNKVLMVIARMVGNESNGLFQTLMEGWDVQCLKAVMRGIHGQLLPDEILDTVGPSAYLQRHHLQELVETPDIPAVVALLRSWSMPWGSVLAGLVDAYRTDHDLKPLEYALDCRRLESSERMGRSHGGRLVMEMIASEAEIINVVLCLNFLGKETRPPLLPITRRHSAVVKRLLSARDQVEAVNILAESPFSRVLDKALPLMTEPGRFAMFERLMDEPLLHQSRMLSLQNPLSIAVPYYYLRCKRNETMNLSLIAHGIHNQIPVNAIRVGLIFPSSN